MIKSYIKENYVLIIILILIHVIFNINIIGPIVGADEYGYLNKALAFTGEQFYGETKYSPGFSILIAPIYWLPFHLDTQYLLLQFFNIFLIVIAFLLLIRIGRELNLGNPKYLQFSALVIMLYPAIMVYGSLALSEIALVTFFLALLTNFILLEKKSDSLKLWLIYGVITGYLYTVHMRSVPIVLTAVILGFFLSVKRRKVLYFGYALIIIFGIMALKELVVDSFIHNTIGCPVNCEFEKVAAEQTYRFSLFKYIHRVLDGMSNFLITFYGQIVYLYLSTFGFLFIGLYGLIRAFWKNRDTLYPVLILCSFLLTLLMSVAFLQEGGARLFSYIIYGRYTEILVPGLLLFGLSYIHKLPKRTIHLFVLLSTISLIGFYLLTAQFDQKFNEVVVTSLWTNFVFDSHKFSLWIIVNGLLSILLIYLIRYQLRISLVIMAGMFLFSAFVFKKKWLAVNSFGFHQSFVVDDFISHRDYNTDQIYFDVGEEFSMDTFTHNYILHKCSYSFYKNEFTLIPFKDWRARNHAGTLIISFRYFPEENLVYYQNFIGKDIFMYDFEPEDPIGEIVDEAYVLFLNRYPDDPGKKSWSEYLVTNTEQSFIEAVVNSKEYELFHPNSGSQEILDKLNLLYGLEISLNSLDEQSLIQSYFEHMKTSQ